MFLKKLIIGLLSFYLFDPKSNSRKQNLSNSSEQVIEREIEEVKKLRKEKKRTQKYDNRKYKRQRKYHLKKLKYSGTRAKDARFSGHRSLRRMYRNA